MNFEKNSPPKNREKGRLVKHHDDAIQSGLADLFEKTVYDNLFSWYRPVAGFSSVTENYPIGKLMAHDSRVVDSPQLVHSVYIEGTKRSCHYTLVMEVIKDIVTNVWGKYDVKVQVGRAKINLLPLQYLPLEGDFYNPVHIDPYLNDIENLDVPENMGQVNMLYYINDSDGDTFFFPGEHMTDYKDPAYRVSPKKGRVVFFEPDQYHASSPPRKTTSRLVLNVNLLTTRPLPEVYKYIEEEET